MRFFRSLLDTKDLNQWSLVLYLGIDAKRSKACNGKDDIYSNSEWSEQFLKQNVFLTYSWSFFRSNTSNRAIIMIGNQKKYVEKVRKQFSFRIFYLKDLCKYVAILCGGTWYVYFYSLWPFLLLASILLFCYNIHVT